MANSSHSTADVNVAEQVASHSSLFTQGAYQIEAMCSAMLKAAQSQNVEALPYLVQSMAIRIDSLNSAMMTALDGDPDTLEDLRREVFGSAEKDWMGALQ